VGKTEEDEKPPYPEEPLKGKVAQFTDRIPEELGKAEQQISVDSQKLCADIVRAGFQTAHIINKKIREASEKEVHDIGMPLANVVDKYNLLQYIKYASYLQEIQLVYNLYAAVTIRIKEVREDKHIDIDA
jgi:hypothetical protein